MPNPSKGARLYWRKDEKTWVIRDGSKMRRTGCGFDEGGQAAEQLAAYNVSKYQGPIRSSDSDAVTIADVLNVYMERETPGTQRARALSYHVPPLIEYWGAKSVSDIVGQTCREYADFRTTPQMARRELEALRAAVNYYARENKLTYVPKFTLPSKNPPRDRWLTRSEAARLLWAARRTPHLARFILIGLYTGTRTKAILNLQWHPNTTGGWVDFEKGYMTRRGQGVNETKKRTPAIRIPRKLLGHLKRWHRNDKGLLHVIYWQGQPVRKLRRSWAGARDRAGLDRKVTPHTLRHTAATWLMQRGANKHEAAGFLGMTLAVMDRIYGHHHPDHQKSVMEAY